MNGVKIKAKYKHKYKSKKGQQSGSGAAVLVAVLALMVLLYVLFLPPSERQALLNGDEDGSNSILLNNNQSFVIVHPGTLDFSDVTEFEHNIPSFNLNLEISSLIIKKVDSLSIKNSWFDKKEFFFDFNVDDVENTNNFLMSFNVITGKGTLSISLNGQEIYSGVAQGTKTLTIDKSLIKENNLVQFTVSGVGIMFWANNGYILQNTKIAADKKEVQGLISESTFVVTSTEKNNLDTTYLRFFADCLSNDKGVLDVLINNHQVYSSLVDCGTYQKVDFSPKNILSGENTITFKADKGSYLLDRVMVKTNLKEVMYPTYHFSISDKQYNKILDGNMAVVLKIDFVNDIDYKKGTIYINGHKLFLDQRDLNYSRVIDPYVKRGDNALELIPKTRLNVITLAVEAEN